jgi:uncharacterized protein
VRGIVVRNKAKSMIRSTTMLCASLLLACLYLTGHSQSATNEDQYERREAMILMRDGVRLHTVIFAPKKSSEALPFLLLRTPYGVDHYISPEKNPFARDLAAEEYIFVYQDIRGRYGSEGQYVMQRFPRDKKDPKAIDESTDTYDTFDWLLKEVPNNNGKAGMYGISYDGWTTVMGAILRMC